MSRMSVTGYFESIIDRLNEGLGKLCDREGCLFLSSVFRAVEDPFRPFTLRPELTRDGAHFTFEGYGTLGRAIARELGEWEVGPGSRVLLVGDSITAGYPEYEPVLLGPGYGDERHSFGYHLRTDLGCTVINCGISGDLTGSMASRLPTHLDERPDVVVLQGGANDAYHSVEMRTGIVTGDLAGRTAEAILGNFRRMVGECLGSGARCAVMPLLPFYGEFMQGE